MPSLVSYGLPVDLLHKQIDATPVGIFGGDLAKAGAHVHILQRAHQIVHQALAILANHADHAVCARCGVVYCDLQQQQPAGRHQNSDRGRERQTGRAVRDAGCMGDVPVL